MAVEGDDSAAEDKVTKAMAIKENITTQITIIIIMAADPVMEAVVQAEVAEEATTVVIIVTTTMVDAGTVATTIRITTADRIRSSNSRRTIIRTE